jgi:cytochrome P450
MVLSRLTESQQSVVGINPWVAHRNRDIFGEDPDQFRPERWVEADVDRAKSMERYWIRFGSGSRTCIGKNISMLEISKAVPEILQRFDIKLVEASEQMFHHTECDWFVKLKALFVTVKGKS